MKGRVLITGRAGFLGGALAGLLENAPGLHLFGTGLRKNPPGTIPCDLLDLESVRRLLGRTRPRVIFHLAGTTDPGRPGGLWSAHVETTGVLLDEISRLPRARRPRVVISGSSAEYGIARGRAPVRENAPTEPVGPYGASKLAQTNLALSCRHRGLDIRVARIFNVLGPGMPEHLSLGAFSAQIARIECGLQPPRLRVGNLGALRDYLDVRDVARALAAVAESGRAGEIYNVCSGKALPIAGLLRTLLSFSKRSIRVVEEARRKRRGEVSRIAGSRGKLAAASGWRPAVKIRDSLRETLAWHRRRIAC